MIPFGSPTDLPYWARAFGALSAIGGGPTAASPNVVHQITGTTADYTITLPVSPATGTVCGFVVLPWASANKQYTLDAGAGVSICGRTRYLTLVHSNVALLMWDGARWLPLVLSLDSPWVDAGAMSIGAVTTGPSKPTTTVRDKVWWRRQGQNCHVRYEWEHTANAGATTGSGDYLYTIPVGAIDTTACEVSTAAGYNANVRFCRGNRANLLSTASVNTEALVVPYDSTRFRILAKTLDGVSVGMQSNTLMALNNSALRFSFEFDLPLVGW